MDRTVALSVMAYVDVDGLDRFGWLGEEVDVHSDHVGRFDSLNVLPVNTNPEPVPQITPLRDKPAGNASLEAWQVYALSHGDDVTGLTRNEIRDLYAD